MSARFSARPRHSYERANRQKKRADNFWEEGY